MFQRVLTAALLISTAAFGDVDERFAKLRDSATPLTGLATFLEKYIGSCGSVLEGGAECERNAKAFRDEANKKKFYMIVTEDSVSNIAAGAVDQGGGTVMLNLTPIFPASDSALTHGAPSKTDANGNPVLPYLPIKATAGELSSTSQILRQVNMRALRLSVVFTPQGVWTLPKKGGGKIKGVKARFDGILVTVGRTGEEVAVYLNR